MSRHTFVTLALVSALFAVCTAVPVSQAPQAEFNFFDVNLQDDAVNQEQAVENGETLSQEFAFLNEDSLADLNMPKHMGALSLLETVSNLQGVKSHNATAILKLLSTLRTSIVSEKLEAEKELNKTRSRYKSREDARRVNQLHDDAELKRAKEAYQKAEDQRKAEAVAEAKDLELRVQKFQERQTERAAEATAQEETLKDLLEAYRNRTAERKKLLSLIEQLRGLINNLDQHQDTVNKLN